MKFIDQLSLKFETQTASKTANWSIIWNSKLIKNYESIEIQFEIQNRKQQVQDSNQFRNSFLPPANLNPSDMNLANVNANRPRIIFQFLSFPLSPFCTLFVSWVRATIYATLLCASSKNGNDTEKNVDKSINRETRPDEVCYTFFKARCLRSDAFSVNDRLSASNFGTGVSFLELRWLTILIAADLFVSVISTTFPNANGFNCCHSDKFVNLTVEAEIKTEFELRYHDHQKLDS